MIDDGRAPLPPPTIEALKEAAGVVLGEASEAPLGDDGTKLFAGMAGVIFLQGANESCGTWIGEAPRELQDRLLVEAQRVRKAAQEVERATFSDPTKNPMIKTDV